jgi:hypothetical protein
VDRRADDRPLTARLTENRWTVRVRDISATGIGILCERVFDAGRLLKVELQSPDGSTACTLSVCVVRAVQQPDGSWLVGAAFTEPLAESELRRLLA